MRFVEIIILVFSAALADFADIPCSPRSNNEVRWTFSNTNSFTVIIWWKDVDCILNKGRSIAPRETKGGTTLRGHTFLVTNEANDPVDSYVVNESATQHWDIEDKRKDEAVAEAVEIPAILAETSTEQSVHQEPVPPAAEQEPQKVPVLPPLQPEPARQDTQQEVSPDVQEQVDSTARSPASLTQPEMQLDQQSIQQQSIQQATQQEVSPNVQEQGDPTARSPASLTQPELQLDQQPETQQQQQQDAPKRADITASTALDFPDETLPNEEQSGGAGTKLQGSRSSGSQIVLVIIIASIVGAVTLSFFALIGFLFWTRKKRQVERIKRTLSNDGSSASHTPSLFSHWNLWGFKQASVISRESFTFTPSKPAAIRTNSRNTKVPESIGISDFGIDSVELELKDKASGIPVERRGSFPRILEVAVLQDSAS
jgi:hypothetical protein